MHQISDYQNKKKKIGIVGLGYVGLPLATLFDRHFSVIGIDTCQEKVKELKNGVDRTHEVNQEDLQNSHIFFTTEPKFLQECSTIIVAVPTPVDGAKRPNLNPLRLASKTIGQHMQKGTIVVFESTVYPGVTEKECGEILEVTSGLKRGTDFFLGYSPERVNPGDKNHTLEKIVKVVSGENSEVCQFLEQLYGTVVTAGIFKAKDIPTAEAAKVIENTQRDLNIALINELAIIFGKMGLDTQAVLEAARTKWNFLPFSPGLVGGHCIGVDPYYLTYAAEKQGYYPEVILAGRRINDAMGSHIVKEAIKNMVKGQVDFIGAKALVCGLTFKENVPDIRNSKVIDIIRDLQEFGIEVTVHDPLANPEEVKKEFEIHIDPHALDNGPYQLIVLAVSHNSYNSQPIDYWVEKLSSPGVFMDVKSIYNKTNIDGFYHWRL